MQRIITATAKWMAAAEGVNEQMRPRVGWGALMNGIRQRAVETVLNGLFFISACLMEPGTFAAGVPRQGRDGMKKGTG